METGRWKYADTENIGMHQLIWFWWLLTVHQILLFKENYEQNPLQNSLGRKGGEKNWTLISKLKSTISSVLGDFEDNVHEFGKLEFSDSEWRQFF